MFGMKKDLMRVSNPQECYVCNQIFLTPQDLILHFDTFHSNHHFSTFSSSATAAPTTAAPTTFRHYSNLNRNPTPASPERNRLNLNYYRSGYMDEQGRLHKGFPAQKTNFLFGQQDKPKLMDLCPVMSSEGLRTLPLISQLEQPRPQDTVMEKGRNISSSIDLTLRL